MLEILKNVPLFHGVTEEVFPELIDELKIKQKSFKKGEFILHEGEVLKYIGIVLSGMVIIQYTDAWGNNSILGNALKGMVFGEAYACVPDEALLISVQAAENTHVAFIPVEKILESPHRQLTANLLKICANKNLQLSRKILHTSSKKVRGRLMSYFSECAKKAESTVFTVPYNRQQLADYLNLDRSAMCNELSKMQDDGIIEYKKNSFKINDFSE